MLGIFGAVSHAQECPGKAVARIGRLSLSPLSRTSPTCAPSGNNSKQIARLAARHRLPAVYSERNFVDAGGLMFYGAGLVSMYNRAAFYVDKILKGAKPAELPVEQPTQLERVVNLKTARALGLEIPMALLARADQVIE